MIEAMQLLRDELAALDARRDGILCALAILEGKAGAVAPKQIEGPERTKAEPAVPKRKAGRPSKTKAKTPEKPATGLVPVRPNAVDNEQQRDLEGSMKSFRIGGRLVILTTSQHSMIELMMNAGEGEFVTSDTLKAECGDDAYVFQREMRELRTKIEAVGYTVEGVRGSGYRVQKAPK